MRTILCFLALAVSWISLLSGGVQAGEEKIPLDKLPEAVVEAVKKRFPKAELVAAAKKTRGYNPANVPVPSACVSSSGNCHRQKDQEENCDCPLRCLWLLPSGPHQICSFTPIAAPPGTKRMDDMLRQSRSLHRVLLEEFPHLLVG